jgi:hypothetical protein
LRLQRLLVDLCLDRFLGIVGEDHPAVLVLLAQALLTCSLRTGAVARFPSSVAQRARWPPSKRRPEAPGPTVTPPDRATRARPPGGIEHSLRLPVRAATAQCRPQRDRPGSR